ncbi:MAG: hypothetical protein FK734_05055 [Asgard group archaeon]|nr:hypothetical protein [Asgard group archaeon]
MSTSKNAAINANIWTFFIGGALLVWGIIVIVFNFAFSRNIAGTPWLVLVGGIMIIAGISNVISYRYNREKVLGALQSYERVSLSQLSSELKLSEKQTKDIIVNLRSEGQLRASFEPETGDILVLSVQGKPPTAVVPVSSSGLPEHEEKYLGQQLPKDQTYCQYCGTIVKPGDKFCNNCGSFLS